MSVEKIAAIKAKRLAKKRTTIKVDDDLEAGVLVITKNTKRLMGGKKLCSGNFFMMYLLCFDLAHNYFTGLRKFLLLLLLF